jgi:hypothetical protein
MGVPPATLDSILALQLSVAWAGEARSQPPRLGWWQTDLVDDAGGADLLSRLVPRTHAWATLEAVREAARRVDERTRRRSGAPDRLLTLFQLGLELDEQLAERIAHHRRRGTAPTDALGSQLLVGPAFDRAGFEAFVRQSAPPPNVETVPEGRAISGSPPADHLARARMLVAALAPFTPEYPMPHFKLEEGKR